MNEPFRPDPGVQPGNGDAEAGFGPLLRRYRLAAGLTQESLAERAGLGVRSIQALERAEGRPLRDTAARLAEALELDDDARDTFSAAAGPIPRRRSTTVPETPRGTAPVHLVPWRAPSWNLPEPLTSFVGRERESMDVVRLLAGSRLLTLTGPAGTGKTRLAVRIASHLRAGYADGVMLVPLAAVSEPSLVIPTIAAVAGVEQGGDQTLGAALTAYLRSRNLLLILGNFEQVVAAAPRIAELLAACPSLSVLATSRVALHVSGEQEYAVPPLPLPDAGDSDPCDADVQSHAVALFVQRAQAVKPEFGLTAQNAPQVAEICRRLDGLPLAIELAAARIKLLAPEELLARLTHRLDLLVGGPRDLAERQQTMRGAIAWSYDLLDALEQRLFRRLAIFKGGWTLGAAEAVCGGEAPGVLDTLGSLLDKSLLRVRADMPGERRYGMLETLRDYALEQLQVADEAEEMGRRHAGFFLELAEQSAPCPSDAPRQEWLAMIGAEQENLRAALHWALERGELGMATRLVLPLVTFWSKRGELSEARELLDRLRGLDEGIGHHVSPDLQAQALASLAAAVWHQGDVPRAHALFAQCLALARERTLPATLLFCLDVLGYVALIHGDYERATVLQHEAVALARSTDDRRSEARALAKLGDAARAQGDVAQVRAFGQESLALGRDLGDGLIEGYSLNNLGFAALLEPDLEQATALFSSSLALFRAMDFAGGMAEVLANVGRLARAQSNWERARTTLAESLSLASAAGPETVVPDALDELAGLATEQGEATTAIRLFAAAQALRDARHLARWPAIQARYDRDLASAQALLDAEAYSTAWAEGRAMALKEAIALALVEPDA